MAESLLTLELFIGKRSKMPETQCFSQIKNLFWVFCVDLVIVENVLYLKAPFVLFGYTTLKKTIVKCLC